MKNLLYINIMLLLILYAISNNSIAQVLSCSYESAGYLFDCSEHMLKSQNNLRSSNYFKTVRVNVHFMLRTDGTGNFTETENIYGATSQHNVYWFAQMAIDLCNSQLTNETMTQQLSDSSIPVEPINYGYKLSGVFFHRNTSYFNSPGIYSSLRENHNQVINIFVYPGNQGSGAATGQSCWVGGAEIAYTNYLQFGNWGIERFTSRPINHEVGHCLSLDHCKRSPGGVCCINDSPTCLDNCEDTPTYLELLNDGYPEPCIWNGPGYSNNIMDYSPLQKAFTPCQIGQVHSYILNAIPNFRYGVFVNTSLDITSFSNNKTYIANTISIPTGSSITIPNNNRLYIEAQNLNILGSFEVPIGSEFEFVPFGI